MRTLVRAGLALVILLTLAVVPVMAEAKIGEHYAFKWDFDWDDEWDVWNCHSQEYVRVVGTFYDQLHEVTDAADGYHWVNHWHAHGKGVGLVSGEQYIYRGGDILFTNPDGGSHVWSQQGLRYSSTGTRFMVLTGKGSAPSYRMRCISHTTINANGDMVTEFERCSIPCN